MGYSHPQQHLNNSSSPFLPMERKKRNGLKEKGMKRKRLLKNESGRKASPKSLLITAALPYANGSIHLGHLLEYIQADILARFQRSQGRKVLYICASDMHGTPVEVNAAKARQSPEEFANRYWKEHQEDFVSSLISFDNYYKTHSPENKALAELFYATMKKKGFIYQKPMNSIFCPACARFLPDRYVRGTCPNCGTADQYGDICESCNLALKGTDLVNPKCSLCGKTPKQKESTHYFFKLSAFQKKLERWLSPSSLSSSLGLQPEIKNLLAGWLKKGLEDWCISRDGPYFGFEIPKSREETGEVKYFYVWLDAPIGYISATQNYCERHLGKKEGMPKDGVKKDGVGSTWEQYWKKGEVQHFIGKDIIYFHYLFWPAMLMVMGIPLPRLTTHGFITVNGQKMSKSRGTFFTAKDFLKLYPVESLRFYYASHLDRTLVDINLDFEHFKALNNNVLLGSLGNFCYRVLSFAQAKYGGVTRIAVEKERTARVRALMAKVKECYQMQDFKSAVQTLLKIADEGNQFFQKAEPWKNPEQAKGAVGWCVNNARNLGIMVAPILPLFSEKIRKACGDKEMLWDSLGFTWKGKLNPVEKLVEKIELSKDITSQKSSVIVREVSYLVSSEVEGLGVKVRLAQLSGLMIKKKHEGVETLKRQLQQNISFYENKDILEEYRALEKKTGVDSGKHPNAVIHLLKLLREKGKLPQINTAVDVYNLVSAESGIAMATHDVSKLEGGITVRLSAEGEHFFSLEGTAEKLKAGEVVYADDAKVIGRFSKQCKQTMTTLESTDLILVTFGNTKTPDVQIDQAVRRACDLLVKYNGGTYRLIPPVSLPSFPLDLVVGKIISVQDHPNAEKLYVLQLDLGKEKRQVVAGIKKWWKAEELLNRKVVLVRNMKPAKLRGELSQGMILAADDGGRVVPLFAEKTAAGETVSFKGLENRKAEVSFDEFQQLIMTIVQEKVMYDGKNLLSAVEGIIVRGVREGARVG